MILQGRLLTQKGLVKNEKFIGYILLIIFIVGPIVAIYFLEGFETAFVYTFIVIIVPLAMVVAGIIVAIILHFIDD